MQFGVVINWGIIFPLDLYGTAQWNTTTPSCQQISLCFVGTKVILEEQTEKKLFQKKLFLSPNLYPAFSPQASTEQSRISTDLARLHCFYFSYSWAKYTIEGWVVISSLFKYILLYMLRERGWNTITHHELWVSRNRDYNFTCSTQDLTSTVSTVHSSTCSFSLLLNWVSAMNCLFTY